MAIQAGVRWYICISVIISNIEHLFIFSLAHLYVFFGKMSIWIIFPFFDWIICFYGIEGHVVVQSLSCVWPFATPSAVPRQASLSITNFGACSNSCPSSQWYHPTISSAVVLFYFCLQSCPASGSFLRSWLSASGGQSIGASASVPVFPMNIQDWFRLGLTGFISLQSKGLWRVFSNTTV